MNRALSLTQKLDLFDLCSNRGDSNNFRFFSFSENIVRKEIFLFHLHMKKTQLCIILAIQKSIYSIDNKKKYVR